MPAKCMRKRAKVRTLQAANLVIFSFCCIFPQFVLAAFVHFSIVHYVKAYKQLKLHIVHVIHDRGAMYIQAFAGAISS